MGGREQAGEEGHEIQVSAAEPEEQGWGMQTAPRRFLVWFLPIPTSHDRQPLSLDSGELLKSPKVDPLLLSEVLCTPPVVPGCSELTPAINNSAGTFSGHCRSNFTR